MKAAILWSRSVRIVPHLNGFSLSVNNFTLIFTRLTVLPALVFIVLSGAVSSAHAQQLYNQGNLFSRTNFFDQEFIRDNKIKAIKGTVSRKKDLKPIEDLDLKYEFYFDEEGRLTGILQEIEAQKGVKAQLLNVFGYDANGNVHSMRGSDAEGFFSWHYEYNEHGLVVKETYNRETNKGSSGDAFELDRKIKVFTEEFQYPVVEPKQVKKVFLNRDGREYKALLTYYDDYGLLTETVETYLVTNRKNYKLYVYDEQHRLVKYTDKSSMGSNIEHTYTYDEMGFVQEETITRNGKPALKKEFLYDKSTYLLNALLVRDDDAGSIQITQFTTEFYE